MAHPVQIAAFKRMTPARKLELAAMLWREAKALKAAGLRAQYPELSEEEIGERVREIFLHAGS